MQQFNPLCNNDNSVKYILGKEKQRKRIGCSLSWGDKDNYKALEMAYFLNALKYTLLFKTRVRHSNIFKHGFQSGEIWYNTKSGDSKDLNRVCTFTWNSNKLIGIENYNKLIGIDWWNSGTYFNC